MNIPPPPKSMLTILLFFTHKIIKNVIFNKIKNTRVRFFIDIM